MKKLLFALLFLCAGISSAETYRSLRSSFTTTNETVLLSSPAYLVGVDVGAASGVGSALLIYNSTFTTSVLVSSISLATTGNHYFGETGIEMKGIYYKTTGNSGGVTILYRK